MTTRTTIALDDDAAVLLDEQPPRTGSAYLSSGDALDPCVLVARTGLALVMPFRR